VCVGCLFLRSPSRIPYRTELIPRAPNGGGREASRAPSTLNPWNFLSALPPLEAASRAPSTLVQFFLKSLRPLFVQNSDFENKKGPSSPPSVHQHWRTWLVQTREFDDDLHGAPAGSCGENMARRRRAPVQQTGTRNPAGRQMMLFIGT